MKNLFEETERKTLFSDDRVYRYCLWREWSKGEGYVMFIGLNPSTADETDNDATIRRCIDFAQSWGYQALCMTNLFAFCATKPSDMMAAPEPIGPQNDHHLVEIAKGASLVVACWGAAGGYLHRDNQVARLIQKPLKCFGLTIAGMPLHPCRLPKSQQLIDFYDPVGAIK